MRYNLQFQKLGNPPPPRERQGLCEDGRKKKDYGPYYSTTVCYPKIGFR